MTIQDTQVPIYTKHTLFLYFSDFFFLIWKKKTTKQKQTNNMKVRRQMQMHENMIPKTDKKSSKKVLFQIERNNAEDNRQDN